MGDIPTQQNLVGSAFAATAVTALLSAAAHQFDVSPVAPIAVGAAATIYGGARAAAADLSLSVVGFRAVCGAACGTAMSYAAFNDPWSWEFAGTLTAGGMIASAIGAYLNKREHKLLAEGGRSERRRDPLAAQWEKRLLKICRTIDARVEDNIEYWANGYGYNVTVDDLGESGKTWRQLKGFEARLASHAKLRPGCGVEVVPGEHQGAAVLKVCVKNALAETCWFPRDFAITSIADPIRLGRFRDSEAVPIDVREDRTIVVGPQKSGKTNLLRTITGEILKTDDAVVRIIDLNGGGLAWPWLRPWIAGRTNAPIIDWVGSNPDEALKLASDTLWECHRRKNDYDHLLSGSDDDQLPVGPGFPPAIVLIVDEGAETGGQASSKPAAAVGLIIQEIRRIGRAVNINVIDSYLRATVAMTGATANKKLSSNRILMQVAINDGDEGAHLFGRQVNPEDAPFPGCGWVATRVDSQRPFRADRTVGKILEEIVLACTDRRPKVEPSPNYVGRWERITLPSADGSKRAPAPRVAPEERTPLMERAASAIASLKKASLRARTERETNRFEAIMTAGGIDPSDFDVPAEPTEKTVAEKIQSMHEVIRKAQDAGGIGWEAIQARLEEQGIAAPKSSLLRWLKQEKDAKRIRNVNGKYFPAS